MLLLMAGLGMGGCTYSLDWGNPDYVPSCGAAFPGGGGNPDFSYVCPTGTPAAPTMPEPAESRGGEPSARIPQCALYDSLRALGFSAFGVPTVAVGEPFRIEYDDGDAGPDASDPPVPAEPAVDGLAHETAEGVG